MERSSSSYDGPSGYMPPAEPAAAIESELGKAELVIIDFPRFGSRIADRQGEGPVRRKAIPNSCAPSKIEIVRVSHLDRNQRYRGIVKQYGGHGLTLSGANGACEWPRGSGSLDRWKGSGPPEATGAEAIVEEARELTIESMRRGKLRRATARNWPHQSSRAEKPPMSLGCWGLPIEGSSWMG